MYFRSDDLWTPLAWLLTDLDWWGPWSKDEDIVALEVVLCGDVPTVAGGDTSLESLKAKLQIRLAFSYPSPAGLFRRPILPVDLTNSQIPFILSDYRILNHKCLDQLRA